MIGITERGDASLHMEWISKLPFVDFAILITKGLANASQDFFTALDENKGKLILHITCTGYGGTCVEPNVPTPKETHTKLITLLDEGFPVKHIVLRVDPIIPTLKGIHCAENVLKLFAQTGIKRVRYSFLDMYSHVVRRFAENNINHPYNGRFEAPQTMQINAMHMINNYRDVYNFESCAESIAWDDKCGCISQKDADILGIKTPIRGSACQRRGCLCPATKQELLTHRGQCKHGCLYCYWK